MPRGRQEFRPQSEWPPPSAQYGASAAFTRSSCSGESAFRASAFAAFTSSSATSKPRSRARRAVSRVPFFRSLRFFLWSISAGTCKFCAFNFQ